MKRLDASEKAILDSLEIKDPELADRWNTIVGVRKEVTKALEIARKAKMIGHSLDASVLLGVSDELMDLLGPYESQLKYLFIVSFVTTKSKIGRSLSNQILTCKKRTC